jgi:hypothetical protein
MEDSERKESNEIQRYCRGQVAYYYLVPNRFYHNRTDGRFGNERIKRNPKIIIAVAKITRPHITLQSPVQSIQENTALLVAAYCRNSRMGEI